jgi:AcrR family transcriptional regulator
MVTQIDRRRARGERNRAALLDAALELFASEGFDATTIELIAERAGVAPRTFLNHFPSKEDVLFDGYADRLDEVTKRFREAPLDAGLGEALAEVAVAVADSIADHPARYLERARLYEQVPSLRARMLRINEEWIDGMAVEVARRLGADPSHDLRPRLVASLLNGANRAAIEVWAASGGADDLHGLMAEGIELLRPTLEGIDRRTPARRPARAS